MSTDTVTPAIQQASGGDAHVALAMELGALLEGGLGPTFGVGDNGHSFGPFQINLPFHPGVTSAQAINPQFAANYMLSAYQAAVAQIPDSLWQTNPELAAETAAYHAERPAQWYHIARGQGTVDTAYTKAVATLGTPAFGGTIDGGNILDHLPTPGELPFPLPDVPGVLDALNPANWFLEAVKALITNGFVLRGTLMVAGLIILFIGLSQISKGDQTATQTAGSGASTVRVRVTQAAGKVAEGAAA